MTDWDDYTRALADVLRTAPAGATLILLGPGDRLLRCFVHEDALEARAQADGSAGSWRMPPEDGGTLAARGWTLDEGAYGLSLSGADAPDELAAAAVAALRDAMHVAAPDDLRATARTPDGQGLDVSALRIQPPAPAGYDTTGWQENPDGSGWTDPATGLGLSLTIRDELTEPYWLEDLELARRKLARDYGEIGCLIEASPVTLGGVQGMAQLFKVPGRRGRSFAYAASVFLAKTGATVNFGCVLAESAASAGIGREASVAAAAGELPSRSGHPYDPDLESRVPYLASDEEAWDEHCPEHALSVVRAWVRGLDRIVWVTPEFAALSVYRGFDSAR